MLLGYYKAPYSRCLRPKRLLGLRLNMPQIQKIRSKIHSVFHDVMRLPDTAMFNSEMDYLWTESYIGGNEQWQNLPPEFIALECSALRSVTPLGFQFLIPAYMCWLLENKESSSNTSDHTIYALNSSPLSSNSFEFLSIEQSKVICEFLAWATSQTEYLDTEAAQEALNSYWQRFGIDS